MVVSLSWSSDSSGSYRSSLTERDNYENGGFPVPRSRAVTLAEMKETEPTHEVDTGLPLPGNRLLFTAWQSSVNEGFWERLANFKLDTQRLDEQPFAITGECAPTLSNMFAAISPNFVLPDTFARFFVPSVLARSSITSSYFGHTSVCVEGNVEA